MSSELPTETIIEGGALYRLGSQEALNDPTPLIDAVSLFIAPELVAAALDSPALDDVAILADGDITQGMTCDGVLLPFEDGDQVRSVREQLGEDANLAFVIANRHNGLEAGEAGADLLVLADNMSREDMIEIVEWWRDVVTLPLAVPITDRSDQHFWFELGADYTLLNL